jgi:hypothetical protein
MSSGTAGTAGEKDAGATPNAAKKPTDVVFVHGPTPSGVQITRLREDRVEAGELRPMKEGQPIAGEVVKLSRREESDRLFDVEVLAKVASKAPPPTDEPARDRKGPSRVSNERFRANWDIVFGASSRKKSDLPS